MIKKTANLHRTRYLNRALNIKGDWRNNPYSANFLSILLLWDYEQIIDFIIVELPTKF